MKRMKRTSDYEVTLQIKSDSFLRTPRESQRNWMVNRSMKEFADELEHLSAISIDLIAGTDSVGNLQDRTHRALTDDEIMEDWQIPVMKAMAAMVTEAHGDVLEIGFGRGIGSDFIQAGDVASHTIIECNETIVDRCRQWHQKYPDATIRVVPGLWQDVIDTLAEFDGIFFHTYPLNEADFVQQVAQSSTFAEHFFVAAAKHLRPGGVFTYMTNESDSLSRAHQRALLKSFDSFSMSVLDGLEIPEDTSDAMWTRSIVMVKAIK